MSRERKTAELLRKAVDELGAAIKAYREGEEEGLSEAVWQAAFDMEYVTFLISLSRGEGEDAWKEGWKASKSVDVEDSLLAAQNLLKEALSVADVDGEEVYRKAWFARGHVLSVQRELERASPRARRSRRPS